MKKIEKNKQILIVDDEEFILDYIEEIFSDSVFVTRRAHNGKEAIDLLASSYKPDLIILDYMMPEMNGIDVLRYLDKEGILIPCIVVTGKGSEEVAVTMLKEGAFDYLTKPFKEEELLNTVNKAIELNFMTSDNYSNAKHELLWLRQENNFLKEQVSFMRKFLQMDNEGDITIDTISKKLIEMDVKDLQNNPHIIRQQIEKIRKISKPKSGEQKSYKDK